MKITSAFEGWLIRLGAAAAAVAAIIGAIELVSKLTLPSISQIEPYTTGLNLLIVLVFCLVSIHPQKLEFFDGYAPTLGEKKTLDRVNRLMKQLNSNIILYAGFLMLVYAIYFLIAIRFPGDISGDAKNLKSILDEFANLFNFLSAMFVYLAFKVLYDKTLDRDNEPIYYYMDAVVFAVMLIASYLIMVKANFFGLPDKLAVEDNIKFDLGKLKNNFSLIIGILNGLAMGLLFARFISMENSLINIFEKNSKGEPQLTQKFLIKNLMIFLLPLYAVVQPIFGNFKIQDLGPPEIHKNIVFFICLVGKAFFLSIYYYYAKRKWIQIYMYNALNRQGLPEKLKGVFKIDETYWEKPD